MNHGIVIIGSGFAARQLVKNIRKQDANVPLTLIAADSTMPIHQGESVNKIQTNRPAPVPSASPPRAPDQVLEGEMSGASFSPPICLPLKKAAVSVIQTTVPR